MGYNLITILEGNTVWFSQDSGFCISSYKYNRNETNWQCFVCCHDG